MDDGEKRILVVDDDPDIRERVQDLLRRNFKNVELFSAIDGKEGFSLFQEKSPYCVVTDCGMPEMNGLELAFKIRQEVSGTVHIILFSAHDLESWECIFGRTIKVKEAIKELNIRYQKKKGPDTYHALVAQIRELQQLS